MMIFISGGVRSGKSSLGERLVAAHPTGRKVYLATSQIYDEEMADRIMLHRDNRAGKGFITLERSRDIATATDSLQQGDAVLLDCLGTLAANEMFGKAYVPESAATVDALFEKILNGISVIRNSISLIVVISNEVFSDGVVYDGMTEGYIRLLGRLHCALTAQADVAIECASGCHTVHKGSLEQLFV